MRPEPRHNTQDYAILFQQGQEEALEFFYREFHPALALFAFRYIGNRGVAEEIASEALLKTWKNHAKLNNYQAIRAYLYKTVQRDCQRSSEKERKMRAVHKISNALSQSVDTPFDNLVRAEMHRIIHSAMKDLSPGSKRVLTMHYFEGKSTGEIARELHLSPSTVKTQKSKGLEALRKKLIRPLSFLFCIFIETFFSS